ncbi:MAG: ATP-binding protein, partial [Planctomycetota bacterium]|nr:ATP-binding protein [Planctomycetota bacterium]
LHRVLLIHSDLIAAGAGDVLAAQFSIARAASFDDALECLLGGEVFDAAVFCCGSEMDLGNALELAGALEGAPLIVLSDLALPANYPDLLRLSMNLDPEALAALIRASADAHRTERELHAARQEVQDLYRIVTHDMGAPARHVGGFVRLLMEKLGEDLTEDQRELAGFATDASRQLQEMLHDLLELSRVRSTAEPFSETDCQAVFEMTLERLATQIEETGARITCDRMPTIQTNEAQWQTVFFNLLDNAVKFRSDETPVIHVGYEQTEREHTFSIRDNGIGIQPQFFERIFAPFQQLHPKNKFPGTGMGLPICKRIIERHGGRIRIESNPEGGSTFHFSIPPIPVEA